MKKINTVTLINMHRAPSYEGLACEVVQKLPNVSRQGDLTLVRVKDHEAHCVEEFIAVPDDNLTSASKAAQRKKKGQDLINAREEIHKYLIGLGLVQERDIYVSMDRNIVLEVMFDPQTATEIEIHLSIEVEADAVYIEEDTAFCVTTLKQFKKEAKLFFNRVFKSIETKAYKEMIRISNDIRNAV